MARGDFKLLYGNLSVDDLMMDYMQEHHIPGMALAIVQAPYIPRVVAYGVANIDKKMLVGTRTVFKLGEITNGYTIVAIMQLKEEGKVRLDDLINTFISDLPKSWQDITVKQLLTQTSGLPDYRHAKHFDYSKEYAVKDILGLISLDDLLFSPGTMRQRSATNAYLLGVIIEKTSKMSYQEYVTKNQIERLGLKHTFFISNVANIMNEVNNGTTPFAHSQFLNNSVYINPIESAEGYIQQGQNQVVAQQMTWSASFSNSGMLASAEDVSIWDIGLAGNILIKDEKDRQFVYNAIHIKDQVIPGNGNWLFPGHPGLMVIEGNAPGYSSLLARFTAKDEQFCVTLLANKNELLDMHILARKIAAAFDTRLASQKGSLWSECVQSPYSVKKTIARVKHLIENKGGQVFAHINHALEAKHVNLSLLDTEVLFIGNPSKGTALMQQNQAIALDLPLRIMANKDNNGQIWLSYTNPIALARQYDVDIDHLPELNDIMNSLRIICKKAVSADSDEG